MDKGIKVFEQQEDANRYYQFHKNVHVELHAQALIPHYCVTHNSIEKVISYQRKTRRELKSMIAIIEDNDFDRAIQELSLDVRNRDFNAAYAVIAWHYDVEV
jgi:hypothetical protein